MLIQNNTNTLIQSNASSIQQQEMDIDEDMLCKFYEERQSFVEDSISRKTKGNQHQSNQEKKTMKKGKMNFDEISNHRNVIPGNIMSYDTFKSESNSLTSSKMSIKNNEQPLRSQSMRSLRNDNKTQQAFKQPMDYNNIDLLSERSNTKYNNPKQEKEEVIKYEYNTFRQKNIKQSAKEENKNKTNIQFQQSPVALTENNIRKNVLQTEQKKSSGPINLFQRPMNLKSEIVTNGTINNKPKGPIRPMTPVTIKSNIINTNSSISLIPNTNQQLHQSQLDNKSYINNETYASDLSNVISKRKAMADYSNRHKTRQELFNEFYTRNLDTVTKAKEKTDAIRNKLSKEEKDNCSFNPKLSESTERILNDSVTYKGYTNQGDFYKKNMNWKHNRDNEVQHQSILQEKEKFEECYFHPTTNKELHELTIKEMKGQKPDYVYRKNVQWLKQINQNKKQGQLEQLEYLKQEQEKIKEQNQKLITLGNKLRCNQSNQDVLNQLAQPKHPVQTQHNNQRYRSQSAKKNSSSSLNHKQQNYAIDKDLTEIKDLISSLKDTLSENRNMNGNYNRDMILIDQSCNVNIVNK